MNETVILYLIIFLLSLFQAIVGVGLLLFGTPLLLILGYDFFDALALLLPVSFAISLVTFIQNIRSFELKPLFILTPIPTLLGLKLALEHFSQFMVLIIALWLLLVGIVQLSKFRFRQLTSIFSNRNYMKYAVLYFTAFVHGMTNQGGALLVWVSEYFGDQKVLRRNFISFFYALMAASQIGLLIAEDSERVTSQFSYSFLIIGLLAFVFGTYLFSALGQHRYSRVISWSMIAFSCFIMIKLGLS